MTLPKISAVQQLLKIKRLLKCLKMCLEILSPGDPGETVIDKIM